MTAHHELTDDDLAAIGTGLGGVPVVRELRASRVSRHLLLLKYISEEWREDRGYLDAAVETLAAAQQRRPDVFRRLLGDPLVGAWLTHTTRQLRRQPSGRHTGDLLHLGALAASAALEAGIDAELTVYARQGRVTLPALGDVVLPETTDGPLTIRLRDGRARIGASIITVRSESRDWLPLRRLTARHGGHTCTVAVEDGNPYRSGYHVEPSPRLTAAEIDRWQATFDDAWRLLCRYAPDRAAEIAVGLQSIVPLRDEDPGAARSGTARDSVGALALTPPRSAEDLAITLVHEFQHSKLSAVLDLVDLYTRDGTERHFAPWRTDRRPTGGLIQGVFAFLGIADTWCGLRAAPALRELATDQFAFAREQVHAGLTALEASAELTPAGRQLTQGMRRALDPMLYEELPDAAVRKSRASLERLREASAARYIGGSTTAR